MNAQPHPTSSGAADADADAPMCVYYDGACPLCRAEIATYQAQSQGLAMKWVDASACDPTELGPGLDRDRALARMHVRTAQGDLVQGAAAFVALWEAMPGWRWAARIGRWPGVLPVLEWGYRGFLRVRPLWRKRVSAGRDADSPPRP